MNEKYAILLHRQSNDDASDAETSAIGQAGRRRFA